MHQLIKLIAQLTKPKIGILAILIISLVFIILQLYLTKNYMYEKLTTSCMYNHVVVKTANKLTKEVNINSPEILNISRYIF